MIRNYTRCAIFIFPALIFFMAVNCHAQSSQTRNGSVFTNVVIPGSTTDFSNTDKADRSDNDYAENDDGLVANDEFTDYLQITSFGFTIPDGATIDGITVDIERHNAGDKSVKDNRVRIVKGGVIGATDKSKGANWDTSDPDRYSAHGSSSDLWGDTWTSADINAAGFGMAISAVRVGGGGGTADPRIDHIRIKVSYTTLLPVELTEFTASVTTEKTIQLTWTTASEKNNDYFAVERSTNGTTFKEISRKKGAGNSSAENKYELFDSNPSKGVAYYRLKQTDFDGKYEYSKVVALMYEMKTDGSCVLKVFPNPCSGRCYVSLSECKEHENSEIIVEVVDALGNKLQSKIPNRSSDGSFLYYFDKENHLMPGIYIVRAFSDKEEYRQKVIAK